MPASVRDMVLKNGTLCKFLKMLMNVYEYDSPPPPHDITNEHLKTQKWRWG